MTALVDMRKNREILGYVLGGVAFVLLLPALMWVASERPDPMTIPLRRLVATAALTVLGLSLSVWSIVYMRRKGDGNPMDAFGHEVAPRTKHLMTEGPYRWSRNPMLTGIIIYYVGLCLSLNTWSSLIILVLFVSVMLKQVQSEERRLRKDFGQEYEDYCEQTGRFGPKWNWRDQIKNQ